MEPAGAHDVIKDFDDVPWFTISFNAKFSTSIDIVVFFLFQLITKIPADFVRKNKRTKLPFLGIPQSVLTMRYKIESALVLCRGYKHTETGIIDKILIDAETTLKRISIHMATNNVTVAGCVSEDNIIDAIRTVTSLINNLYEVLKSIITNPLFPRAKHFIMTSLIIKHLYGLPDGSFQEEYHYENYRAQLPPELQFAEPILVAIRDQSDTTTPDVPANLIGHYIDHLEELVFPEEPVSLHSLKYIIMNKNFHIDAVIKPIEFYQFFLHCLDTNFFGEREIRFCYDHEKKPYRLAIYWRITEEELPDNTDADVSFMFTFSKKSSNMSQSGPAAELCDQAHADMKRLILAFLASSYHNSTPSE